MLIKYTCISLIMNLFHYYPPFYPLKKALTSKWIKRLLYSNPKDGAAESLVMVQSPLNWKKGREEERQK